MLILGSSLCAAFAGWSFCLAYQRIQEHNRVPIWQYDALLVPASKNPHVCQFGWSDRGGHDGIDCTEVVSEGDVWTEAKDHCPDHMNGCWAGVKQFRWQKKQVREPQTSLEILDRYLTQPNHE